MGNLKEDASKTDCLNEDAFWRYWLWMDEEDQEEWPWTTED